MAHIHSYTLDNWKCQSAYSLWIGGGNRRTQGKPQKDVEAGFESPTPAESVQCTVYISISITLLHYYIGTCCIFIIALDKPVPI